MSKETPKKQLALFDVVEKIEKSTATVAELRVPIFAPVQKLSGNSVTAREFKNNGGIRKIDTSWGRVEIRGRKLLTQVHRDLLDCIYTHSKEVKKLENGNVSIIFSQTQILKEYSGDSSAAWTKQTKWLKEKIKEIRDITVNYENSRGDSSDFNIISNLDYIEEMNLYSITLDVRYLHFYEQELSISYKKELPKLLKMDSALGKAIIRWLFTHKDESRFKLMTVLQALGFPVDSPKTLQTAKKEIREMIDVFQSFGIDYDLSDEFFSYRGNPNVGFIPSLFNKREGKSLTSKKKVDLNLLIGVKIFIEERGQEVILKEFEFETKDDYVQSIVINTEDDFEFRINNTDNKSIELFKQEVYELLEKLIITKA